MRSLIGISGACFVCLLFAGLLFRGEADGQRDVESLGAAAEMPMALPSRISDSISEPAPPINPASTSTEWADCSDVGVADVIQAQMPDSRQAYVALGRELSARLAVSPMAEHLHAAALLTDDPRSQMALLEQAIALGGVQPFLIFDAVQFCSAHRREVQCPLREWEAMLIALDGENSETWMRVAYGELVERRGRTELGVAVARAIQRVSFESMGQLDRAEQVEARTHAERQSLPTAGYDTNYERLFFVQPSLFFDYLKRMKTEGEAAARRNGRVDVERLLELRPELACEPAEVELSADSGRR